MTFVEIVTGNYKTINGFSHILYGLTESGKVYKYVFNKWEKLAEIGEELPISKPRVRSVGQSNDSEGWDS